MLSSASALADLISRRAADDPAHVFYEDARSDRVVTAADLARLSSAWRSRFAESGLGPSAAVLIDVDDVLATAVLQLATIASGLRAITIEHGSGRDEPTRIAGLVRGAGMTVGDRGEDRAVAGAPWTAVGANLLPGASRSGTPTPSTDPAGTGAAVLFTSARRANPRASSSRSRSSCSSPSGSRGITASARGIAASTRSRCRT